VTIKLLLWQVVPENPVGQVHVNVVVPVTVHVPPFKHWLNEQALAVDENTTFIV